jgi:hypothetical protein
MGTEWQEPAGGGVGAIDPDVDEATVQRGLAFARVVAVLLLLCGLMYGANVAQIVLFSYWQTLDIVLGELAFAFGTVLFIFVGSRIYDGSYLFTLLGVAAGFGGAMFASLWFVYLLVYGTISLLSFLVAGASALCGVGCLVLVPAVSRVAAARRRLFE